MLNIEKRETNEIITQRNFMLQNGDTVDKIKVEQLKDEIVMLQRRVDSDAILVSVIVCLLSSIMTYLIFVDCSLS